MQQPAPVQEAAEPPLPLVVQLDRRKPVGDQIYEGLRDAIISLQLPPGTPVSENRICRHVGVSRTPVREALIRLVKDDLIDVFPQQGTFVAPIRLGTVHESHFVRRALEAEVLRTAAVRWTPALSGRARDILVSMDRAQGTGDTEAFHRLDEAFHRNFAASAGLEGVWTTIQQAKARVDRVHRLAYVEGRPPIVIAEHAAILDALDRGDAEAAVAALVYHLDRILALLGDLREHNRGYFTE
jgi:GntR family transcriptional regulator, rspAB operon transcriptional repressor